MKIGSLLTLKPLDAARIPPVLFEEESDKIRRIERGAYDLSPRRGFDTAPHQSAAPPPPPRWPRAPMTPVTDDPASPAIDASPCCDTARGEIWSASARGRLYMSTSIRSTKGRGSLRGGIVLDTFICVKTVIFSILLRFHMSPIQYFRMYRVIH